MQEVIIYRSPAEAALWNGIMSGEFFAIVVGLFVFLMVFAAVENLLKRKVSALRRSNLALVVGAVAGISTALFMLSKI